MMITEILHIFPSIPALVCLWYRNIVLYCTSTVHQLSLVYVSSNQCSNRSKHLMVFYILTAPGGSMKSKCTKSSIPSFFSCSTTVPRLERRISGYVLGCISFWYAFSEVKERNDRLARRRKQEEENIRDLQTCTL